MQDLNKLIDVAVDLRVATLKAGEQNIINISGIGTEREAFQFYGEENFAEIIKDKEYSVEKFTSDKYKYTSIISGLKFFCITNELLFEGDENKIAEDK